MKKTNKKGFTIIELVIVIAVIAILAAVLIPTFSGVVEKANKSAALQNCRNELIKIDADLAEKGSTVPNDTIFVSGNYAFKYTDGNLVECDKPTEYKNYESKKVTVLNIIKIQKATQADAKCGLCEGIHAISVTLPEGNIFEGNCSYKIYKNGTLFAEESFSNLSKGTVYFNITTCKNDGSTQFDNLTAAAIGANFAGTYTYEIVAGGTTYVGFFTVT